MPKSKCIKCEFYKENRFTPKGTNVPVVIYNFNVEFEDGTKGVYPAKNKDNPKFKEGEVAEYTVEKKSGTKADGTPWSFNKIRPISNFRMGPPTETSEDREKEASLSAMHITTMFIKGALSNSDKPSSKLKHSHVEQIHARFFEWISLGKESREDINKRTVALKSVVELMGNPYTCSTPKEVITHATELMSIL